VDRVIPFDADAAEHYAEVVIGRRRIGRPIAIADAQIAAIALASNAAVATRDVADFEGCGVAIVNPWEAG
jgi:toxin FitB